MMRTKQKHSGCVKPDKTGFRPLPGTAGRPWPPLPPLPRGEGGRPREIPRPVEPVDPDFDDFQIDDLFRPDSNFHDGDDSAEDDR